MTGRRDRRRRGPGPVLRVALRVPMWLWDRGLGRSLGRWMLLLEHRGRRSGRVHRTVLEVAARDAGRVYAASGFGARSDWFLNVRAHRRVMLETGGRRGPADARVLDDDERAALFERYAREHPLRRRAFRRMIERGVPVVEFAWADGPESPG